MAKSKRVTHTILVMWSIEGLECIFDVTAEEQKLAWAALQNKKHVMPWNLSMMKLRAKVNSQRQYEIYTFESMIPLAELKDTMEESPQGLVNWIRKNGSRQYSDRITKTNKIN